MSGSEEASVRARWARLRFEVVGGLLGSPSKWGELQPRIEQLAQREWKHPSTGKVVRFGYSTVERWYLAARKTQDPFEALARRTRKDAGTHPTLSDGLREAIRKQYADHPTWTYQLHHRNLVALSKEQAGLGTVPSINTLRRYMQEHGLRRCKKKRHQRSQLVSGVFEKRSYEVEHVNQLWHLDFHQGTRAVLNQEGKWVKPWLFGVMDDHSRLVCHLQWYWDENTQNLIHGLCQALLKRGLPRLLLTDGGGAMKAGETRNGVLWLGIDHELTLPETPEQNGKQENFWTQVEQQLLPMLEGVPNLTLALLNLATQAWVEQDYQRHIHSETAQSPIERFLQGTNLGRTCPATNRLRDVFRIQQTRAQRRSDGTISVDGRRFEVPSRFRSLRRLLVRYARWDLSSVDLIDPRTEGIICTLFPLDRTRNANEPRRPLQLNADPEAIVAQGTPRNSGMAPLLRQLMAEYAATGLPPAYLPKDEVLCNEV